MIQANELRIGNWVNEKILGNRQVDGIADICIDLIGDEGLYSIDPDDINPIPLTLEILLKCGFKSGKVKGVTRFVDDVEDIDPADKKKWTYYWDLKIKDNNQVAGVYSFSLVQFGEGADILWKYQMLSVKVTALHQLQNLYFALTGKELEVNL